jgi:hypothetical protein
MEPAIRVMVMTASRSLGSRSGLVRAQAPWQPADQQDPTETAEHPDGGNNNGRQVRVKTW